MSSRPTIHVLLVEDDDGDALLVQRILESQPVCFVVEVVQTASDAVERIEAGGIDVALLDLDLPDSDGVDTVLRFRTLFPNLPVVVLTGTEDERLGLQAVECGAQDYLGKNIIAGQLLFRAIRFAIARQKAITYYKQEAYTDPLTGLASRRAFDAALRQELEKTPCALSLLMLDVDRFKTVNDEHGHRAGDHLLRQLGESIREIARPVDIAARFGGDEFAVILPSTTAEESQYIAGQYLQKVNGADVPFEGAHLSIDVSVGVAEAHQNDDISSILERADAALYAAKSAGRHRGFFHDGSAQRQIETVSLAY